MAALLVMQYMIMHRLEVQQNISSYLAHQQCLIKIKRICVYFIFV